MLFIAISFYLDEEALSLEIFMLSFDILSWSFGFDYLGVKGSFELLLSEILAY